MSIRRPQEPVSAHPTSPDLLKKVEKEIMKEAKNEESNLKHVIKDLSRAEKQENYAHKTAVKAEKTLGKEERKEQSTLKNLHKAEHSHDVAVSSVHQAQHQLEMSSKNFGKVHKDLEAKKVQVDEAIKANDAHTQERNAKLTALRGPAGGEEAARVIPEVAQN